MENKAKSGNNNGGRKRRYITLLVIVAVFLALELIRYLIRCEDEYSYFVKNCVLDQLQLILSMAAVFVVRPVGFFSAAVLELYRIVISAVNIAGGYSVDSPVNLISSASALIVAVTLFICLNAMNRGYKKLLLNDPKINSLMRKTQDANRKALETDRQLAESTRMLNVNKRELYHLAYYDQLTGLANMTKIRTEVACLIKAGTEFALIFIGLDNFGVVNESKGYDAGDKVLVEVGRRLSGAIEDSDLCGRLGGDEFVVLSRSHFDESDCAQYITRICESLAPVYSVDGGLGFYINASIGTAFYPGDGSTGTELIRNAVIALNRAKNSGKNRYVLFKHSMHKEIEYRNRIAMMMRHALENNEFYLVYQPQFFPNKKLRGFEALLRWSSPELGNVSPVTFIPIAEETGFITELGKWIFETACRKLKEILDHCDTDILMSVNMSSHQFGEEDFMKTVSSTLMKTGADSKHIEVEVTESLLLNDPDEIAGILKQLKRMNMHVAIDDFGTGYSSLSYLRILPIDTLKIDKSFIDALSEDSSGKSIVSTIIQLAHTLGMTVIAEGVEQEEQLDYLSGSACDCIQGFLFSKPLRDENVEEIVREYGLADRTESK